MKISSNCPNGYRITAWRVQAGALELGGSRERIWEQRERAGRQQGSSGVVEGAGREQVNLLIGLSIIAGELGAWREQGAWREHGGNGAGGRKGTI